MRRISLLRCSSASHLRRRDHRGIAKGGGYEFLVLFTSTVGWFGDYAPALRPSRKRIHPSGSPSSGLLSPRDPDRALNECNVIIDFVCCREFDFSRRRVRQRQAVERDPRHLLLGRQRRHPAQSRSSAGRGSGRHALGYQDLQARHGRHPLQRRPFLLHLTSRSYLHRGLPRRSAPSASGPRTLSGHAWRKALPPTTSPLR